MQVLPGKHAAEMPMVSPKGHMPAAPIWLESQEASVLKAAGRGVQDPGGFMSCATRPVLCLLRNRINGMYIRCKSGFASLVYTSGLGGPVIAICRWERPRTW